MDDMQSKVREFHEAMGTLPAPAKPVPLAQYNGELRCALIEEEAREFRDAWAAPDRLEMIDALCDRYLTLGVTNTWKD